VDKNGKAGQATDDNIIRRMRIACCITKATDTLRIRNTYCFPTATMVTRTRLYLMFIRTVPVPLSTLRVNASDTDRPVCIAVFTADYKQPVSPYRLLSIRFNIILPPVPTGSSLKFFDKALLTSTMRATCPGNFTTVNLKIRHGVLRYHLAGDSLKHADCTF
jgi:hypothetical protein